MECRDILINWLNNAYAIEMTQVKTLEAHADDAAELPEYESQLREHIEETREQAERVHNAIESLGGDVSTMKDISGQVMGYFQGIAAEPFGDKLVKNAVAEHAAEHLEMATYQAIAVAATACQEDEVAEMAQEIMEQEKMTGEKLESTLEMVVNHYLEKTLNKEE